MFGGMKKIDMADDKNTFYYDRGCSRLCVTLAVQRRHAYSRLQHCGMLTTIPINSDGILNKATICYDTETPPGMDIEHLSVPANTDQSYNRAVRTSTRRNTNPSVNRFQPRDPCLTIQ